jgi:hypothetical protein
MKSQAPLKVFLALAILVVVSSVSYGIFLIGSPGSQRTLKFDERRVADLTNIARAIDIYREETGKLPESLDALKGRRVFIRSAQDPETGELYEYRELSEKGYELCAVFNIDSATLDREFPPSFSERVWEHSAGRVCFGLEAESIEEIRGPVAPVRP